MIYKHFKIELHVCDQCSIDNNYEETIKEILKKEFPKEYKQVYEIKGNLSANSPFISRHIELWEQYEAKCLLWEYDDWNEAICMKHLKEFIKEKK